MPDNQAKRLVEAARRLSTTARATFLNGVGAADPELRKEVESLLASRDEAETSFDSAGAISASVHWIGDDEIPERVGPYRILQLIGEGGMGVVYEASQEEPVRRKVALKLIKWGMDTKQVVARFESERQALALMNHPNIASVHDAGATEQGRLYFAMEFVQGTPLTEYCDKHQLSIPERLELLIQVCEGVQHAHQKGVIHRDLKPSNILVALQDDEPVPKIIDFGLAKATGQRLTARTLFTERGQLIGTPEYMSPEQAETGGIDVDTRTDVYSLGAMLYEILAGARPLDTEKLPKAGLDEVRRRIREDDPLRPSSRVSTLGDKLTDTAENRRSHPGELARALRGDLDWIVLRALAKERSHRYGSPAELAADLARFLRHEPVVARPPSRRYRLRKFVRRHRLGVMAAGLVVLAVVLGAVGLTLGLVKATEERRVATREKEKAEAIAGYLRTMLSAPDPSVEGRDVRVLDVLDRAIERVGEDLGGQPEVEAAVRQTLGRTLIGLGQYDDAAPQLRLALEGLQTTLGEEHADTLEAMSDVAAVLYYQGQIDEAVEMGRRILTLKRRVLGPNHEETLTSLSNLCAFLNEQRNFDEVEELLRELVERSLEVLGEEHPITNTALNNLALNLRRQNRLEEAEGVYRKTLDIRRRVLGDEYPTTLATMSNLAFLLDAQEKYGEAEQLHREVLETKRRVLGEQHPDTLTSMNGLALTLCKLERFDEADPLYRALLSAADSTLGSDHLKTLTWRTHYGHCLFWNTNFEGGQTQLTQGYAGLKALLGGDHPRTLVAARHLAELYEAWGQPDKAAEYRALLD